MYSVHNQMGWYDFVRASIEMIFKTAFFFIESDIISFAFNSIYTYIGDHILRWRLTIEEQIK